MHFLDEEFERAKVETLKKMIMDDELEELWYYQWELDMQHLIQNRRSVTSMHMIEEIRKRYFREHTYLEILRPNRFTRIEGQSRYRGETDMRGRPDGLGAMLYQSGTCLEGAWQFGKIEKEYRKTFRFSIFRCQYTIHCKSGRGEFTKLIKLDHAGNVYIK